MQRTMNSLTWCHVEREGRTGQSGCSGHFQGADSPDLRFMATSHSTAGCCLLLSLRQLSRFSDSDSALCLASQVLQSLTSLVFGSLHLEHEV